MLNISKLKVGDYISDGTGWYRILEIRPRAVVVDYEQTYWSGRYSKRYVISKEDLASGSWESWED